MATGYEDWIRYRATNPGQALARLEMHLQALQEIGAGARMQADGVIYDPGTILQLLAPGSFLMVELNRLTKVVHRVGIPRMVPVRRVDGGPIYPRGVL